MLHEHDETLVKYKGNVIFERAEQNVFDGHNVDGSIHAIIGVKDCVVEFDQLVFFMKDCDKYRILVVSFQFRCFLRLQI